MNRRLVPQVGAASWCHGPDGSGREGAAAGCRCAAGRLAGWQGGTVGSGCAAASRLLNRIPETWIFNDTHSAVKVVHLPLIFLSELIENKPLET